MTYERHCISIKEIQSEIFFSEYTETSTLTFETCQLDDNVTPHH